MNNAGTVLLTLADMSVIQAEVEVDETNLPYGRSGGSRQDHHRRVAGSHVQRPGDRDRQQPDPAGGAPGAATTRRQTIHQLQGGVVIDDDIPEVRPGFTCTADITTATRNERPRRAHSRRWPSRAGVRPEGSDRPTAARSRGKPGTIERPLSPPELEPGQTRRETKACSSSGRAPIFLPVKVGIAGERYFEVLSGLKAGDEVITGPFNRCGICRTAIKVQTEAEQA